MSYASGEAPLIGDLVEVVDDVRSGGMLRQGEVFHVAGVNVQNDYDSPEKHIAISDGNSWRERRFRLLARAAGNQRINELNARVAAGAAGREAANRRISDLERDLHLCEIKASGWRREYNEIVHEAVGAADSEATYWEYPDVQRVRAMKAAASSALATANAEAAKYRDYFETLMQAVFGCGVFTSEEYTLAKAVEKVKEMQQSDHRRFAIEALSQAGFKEGVLVERIHRCIGELEDARLRASEAAGDAAARIENRDSIETLQKYGFKGNRLGTLIAGITRELDWQRSLAESRLKQLGEVRDVVNKDYLPKI